MDLNISVSLRFVSSNPGVSIKVTMFPFRINGLDVITSLVQLWSPRPTGSFDPLARLAKVDFPVPVAPIIAIRISLPRATIVAEVTASTAIPVRWMVESKMERGVRVGPMLNL